MATKLPPPPNRNNSKGEPPNRGETKENFTKSEPLKIVALNFRVPAEFKREFKIASAITCITQSELLQRAFKLWKEQKG